MNRNRYIEETGKPGNRDSGMKRHRKIKKILDIEKKRNKQRNRKGRTGEREKEGK